MATTLSIPHASYSLLSNLYSLKYLLNTSSLYSLLLLLLFNPCLFSTYHFSRPSTTNLNSNSCNSMISCDASRYMNSSDYMLNACSFDARNCRLCRYILDRNLSKSAAYIFNQLLAVGTLSSKDKDWMMSRSRLTKWVSVMDSSGVLANYSILGG
jgi:hypothetical protein